MYEIGLVDNNSDFSSLILSELLDSEDLLVIGASREQLAVGALAGHTEGEKLFIIDSLFVTPDERRQGVASEMLDTLISIFNNETSDMVYRADIFENDEEAETLISFFYSRGYAVSDSLEPGVCSFVFF